MNIRARHAGMQDVAKNRDPQSVERIFAIANRKSIEQRLGRVLMRAVSGVHNRNPQTWGYEFRSSRRAVANYDTVRTHGFQRPDGVEERFPFLQTGRFR